MTTSERKPLADMTNAELRREVAEWLGYYVGATPGRIPGRTLYHLYKSPANPQYLGHSDDLTLAEAQECGYLYHTPNWPDDLNAAADLLETMQFYFLRYTSDFPEWGKWVVQHLATSTDYFFSDNPARAICLGFCDMKRKEVEP